MEPPGADGKPKIRVALGQSGDSTKYELGFDFSMFVYKNSEDADCEDDDPDAIIS